MRLFVRSKSTQRFVLFPDEDTSCVSFHSLMQTKTHSLRYCLSKRILLRAYNNNRIYKRISGTCQRIPMDRCHARTTYINHCADERGWSRTRRERMEFGTRGTAARHNASDKFYLNILYNMYNDRYYNGHV